jgi:sulfite dehydrogenase (quinone) subunit SoeC
MSLRKYDIVGDEYKVGYRRQEAWGWKIALAFFFGDVGAGTFFVSAFFNYMPGMIFGWILTTFFKPAALFMHLGQPLRFWRAIANVRTAWISRGIVGAILFTGFGFFHMVNLKWGLFGGFLGGLVFFLAMLGCFIVMIYLGYVLSHSPSIPLWNTGLMPLISLIYGLMGGVTMTILFGINSFLAADPGALQFLKTTELILIAITFVMLVSMIHGAAYQSSTGMATVMQLIVGKYSKWFLGYVVLIGIIGTGILALTGSAMITVLLLVAIMELIGDFGLKMVLFKSALYSPPLSHSTV